ncbi:MAG: class I SAM-dependent methyltransferase [Pseudomonadota bacterium]
MESTASDWVSETRFGKWFLSTETWFREVLSKAVADLRDLAGTDAPASFDRMMDVGCGQGLAFALLQKHFAAREIIGVDIDPRMLALARVEARHAGVPVDVRACSVTKLDLPDASVDGVLCHQLIHHVANQQGALRELHRVLKPGGYLFLSESCEAFIRTWTVRWFFRHPEGVQRPAEGYLKLVREAGFVFDEARDVRTSTPWWSLWDFGFTRKIGLVRSPPVATELLLVARRSGAGRSGAGRSGAGVQFS